MNNVRFSVGYFFFLSLSVSAYLLVAFLSYPEVGFLAGASVAVLLTIAWRQMWRRMNRL